MGPLIKLIILEQNIMGGNRISAMLIQQNAWWLLKKIIITIPKKHLK